MLNIGTNFINYDSLFVFSAGIRGNGSLRAFRPFHLSPLLHSLDGVPVVWDKPDFRDLPEAHLLPFQQPVRGYVRKKPHCIPLSGQLLPADQRPWIHRSNDRELPGSYFPSTSITSSLGRSEKKSLFPDTILQGHSARASI